MAEVKNVFVKGKMNKDLDERLIPKGEYREAQNILIGDSEDADVGAIENILGNKLAYQNALAVNANSKVIGNYTDIKTKKIFWFITDFIGNNNSVRTMSRADNLHECKIIMLDTSTSSAVPITLVSGYFLNFSKSHLITGVNIIEDLLFWTDDYNQPRKINVVTAQNDPTYYNCEEKISVAKVPPYTPAILLEQILPTAAMTLTRVVATTLSATPADDSYSNLATTSSGDGTGAILTVVIGSGAITSITVTTSGSGYLPGDTLITAAFNSGKVVTITLQDNDFSLLGDGTTLTKDNNVKSEYLKERFVRFSYRYRYDDGEYTTFAPFTQIIFKPLNSGKISDLATGSGYTSGYSKHDVYKKGIVKIMENDYNKVEIRIPLPSIDEFKTAKSTWVNDLKLRNIEILAKESDGVSVQVVSDIKVDTSNTSFTNNIIQYTIKPKTAGNTIYYRHAYKHTYRSEKPYKTLPEDQTVRVFDKVPVRAKAQEIANNRLIYGNFTENYDLPNDELGNQGINYLINSSTKGSREQGDTSGFRQYLQSAYKYHSLKQKRTYQVGVVLIDRFGRQSPVILSSNAETTLTKAPDTYTNPVEQGSFANLYSGAYSWSNAELAIGKSLDIEFKDTRLVPFASASNQNRSNELFNGTIDDTCLVDGRLLTIPTVTASSNGTTAALATVTVTGSGSGATLQLISSSANINSATVVAAGSGYAVGDQIKVTDAVMEADTNIGTTGGDLVITLTSSDIKNFYNPHGWYAWKLVVKQTEQDYYNVYAPHPGDSWNNTEHFFDNSIEGRSWLTLHGDNINKVPRDVEDVDASREGVSGSNVKLYPKVVSLDTDTDPADLPLDRANLGYSIRNTDTTDYVDVISIGTAKDQNLFNSAVKTDVTGDDAGVTGFSVYSFVHGHDRNPIVAELPNLKTSGSNNSAGVRGTVAAATVDPWTTVTVNPEKTTITIGPSGSSYGVGPFSGGENKIEIGMRVTGPSISPDNINVPVLVSNVTGGSGGSPWSITLSEDQEIPKGENLFFSLHKVGLTVFETKPIESKLDIFYETTTCGLLKDINEQVSEVTNAPTNLHFNSTNNKTEDFEENNASSTIIGGSGNTLDCTKTDGANTVTYSLNSVSNGAGESNLNSKFQVLSNGQVRTAGDFARRNSVALDKYNLEIRFDESNAGVATDTVVIEVLNSDPTITAITPQSVMINASTGTPVVEGTAENGAQLSSSNSDVINLTYSFIMGDTDFNAFFEEDTSTSDGNWGFITTSNFNGSEFLGGSTSDRLMTVTVTDAEGATDSVAVRIDVVDTRVSGQHATLPNGNNEGPPNGSNYKLCFSYQSSSVCTSCTEISDLWIQRGTDPNNPSNPAASLTQHELIPGNIIFTTETGNLRAGLGNYKFYKTLDGNWYYGTVTTGSTGYNAGQRYVSSVTQCS